MGQCFLFQVQMWTIFSLLHFELHILVTDLGNVYALVSDWLQAEQLNVPRPSPKQASTQST